MTCRTRKSADGRGRGRIRRLLRLLMTTSREIVDATHSRNELELVLREPGVKHQHDFRLFEQQTVGWGAADGRGRGRIRVLLRLLMTTSREIVDAAHPRNELELVPRGREGKQHHGDWLF